MSRFLSACCVVFLFFVVAQPVAAQELKTEMIWQKERLDQEISTVKATYQSQLEEYLYHEKLYRIAYDQNAQLQTLVSIEDVIQKAKTLALHRVEVLSSYLNLLRLRLIATEGIELSLKERYLKRLEDTLLYLTDHQTIVQSLAGRDEMALELATFSADQGGLGNLANEVLVLISVGNIQAVYDKSVVLKRDIDGYLEKQGTLKLPEIERASFETNRSLDSAKLKLDNFWVEVINRGQGNWFLAKIYEELPRTMNPIYVNLSQSISYLDELLKL